MDFFCKHCHFTDKKEVTFYKEVKQDGIGIFRRFCPKCGSNDILPCHTLKTFSESFEQVWIGRKTFEIRVNDRDFMVNDYLNLVEIIQADHKETGRRLYCKVTYLLQGVYGLPADVCVMAITVKAYHHVEDNV